MGPQAWRKKAEAGDDHGGQRRMMTFFGPIIVRKPKATVARPATYSRRSRRRASPALKPKAVLANRSKVSTGQAVAEKTAER